VSENVPVRIRIPMVPEVTTTPENIARSIVFMGELNRRVEAVDLLPFHNTANEKYKRFHLDNQFAGRHSMKKEELTTIKNQFEEAGFTVKIGG
jgi:pyruvate formate lyase activating enzyme